MDPGISVYAYIYACAQGTWIGLDLVGDYAVSLLLLSGYPGYSCSVGQEGRHDDLSPRSIFFHPYLSPFMSGVWREVS